METELVSSQRLSEHLKWSLIQERRVVIFYVLATMNHTGKDMLSTEFFSRHGILQIRCLLDYHFPSWVVTTAENQILSGLFIIGIVINIFTIRFNVGIHHKYELRMHYFRFIIDNIIGTYSNVTDSSVHNVSCEKQIRRALLKNANVNHYLQI